ncbi:MAG: SDR family oxidoreductase [Actinobacteria bacterium]|nr:SDR family oxidoreductase [Actinomycetota bacterium]
MRFARRRGLVTGGASGIGLATAELLRSEGAAVALLDRRADAVVEASERIGGIPVVADVAEPGSVAEGVRAAAEGLGGPADVLVNAAGIYRIAPVLELDVAEWDEVLDVNLRGSFLVAREVVRALVAAGRGGAIVNLSSIAALIGDTAEPAAHYNASKAGVIAMTKQMAVEWAPHGVRVNAVCPGVIDTPMLRIMDDPGQGEAYLRERVPLGRLGEPGEVAAVIAFLASDAASYVTGVTVAVDGGVTAL